METGTENQGKGITQTIADIQKLHDGLPVGSNNRVEVARLLEVIKKIAREDEARATETTEKEPATVTINAYWGLCPKCWAEGVVKDVEWVNIYKAHFCYCGKHKVYWRIGENLLSSWRYEAQELWDKNRAMLEQCQEVSPLHTKPFAYSITLDHSSITLEHSNEGGVDGK
jgi:hypothetical protein